MSVEDWFRRRRVKTGIVSSVVPQEIVDWIKESAHKQHISPSLFIAERLIQAKNGDKTVKMR